jgi:hypothetical protein
MQDNTDELPFDEDTEDENIYSNLDELERLETIITLMEEMGLETLADTRARFEALERSIEESNA